MSVNTVSIGYCLNCETEGTHYYNDEKGVSYFLCRTCAEAFELGQTRPEVDVIPLDTIDIDNPDDEEPPEWPRSYWDAQSWGERNHP